MWPWRSPPCAWRSARLRTGSILRTGTIDTDSAQIQEFAAEPTLGAGYYLVQLRGPVTEDNKAALADAGCELIEYIPDDAFLVRMQHSSASGVR